MSCYSHGNVIGDVLPTNVRLADRIVVLESGRVIQEGTHAELAKVGGLYSRMFETQASGYR